MYITDDNTQNNPFSRLKLVVETCEHSTTKVLKVVKPRRVRKHYQKTLGTSVLNSPMSPPSLDVVEIPSFGKSKFKDE